MISAQDIQRIYVQIGNGVAKSACPFELTPEMSTWWDRIEPEVADILDQGFELEVPEIELPDVHVPYPLEDAPEEDTVTAAAGDPEHTGSMIALIPEDDDAARLAISDASAETPNELHITLAYLGDATDWSQDARDLTVNWVRRALESLSYDMSVLGTVFGVNVWNIYGDEPSVNLAVGGEDLAAFRDAIWSSMVTGISEEAENVTPSIPEQHTPWVPHVCLAYVDTPGALSAAIESASDESRFGPVAFDRVRVAFGGKYVDISIVSES